MDPTERRGYRLRVWRRGIDAQPRVRRRSLARQEPPPEPANEEVWNDLPGRYRDAAGVWQGGRDGIGWTRL